MKTYYLIFAALLISQTGPAFDGRVLAPGQKPNDQRLGKPVTLQDYHPFRPVTSAEQWPSRREAIQTRVKVAAGLLPEPEKTPLNAVISDRVEKDGFAIQKVYFESFPGHYVTGTLFSPAGDSSATGLKNGKRPVVLCPHGHWKNGRFYDAGDAGAKAQIAEGAERFYNAAINPLHARCVQLARMGCLVYLYDMLGNADSLQFPEHRNGPREDMNSKEAGKWGFVSPQAILRLQTNFGLQTWNSVRALDMMMGLPEADPDRVLVTGASGGATQTMMLAAIDDRVDASFPCVMASTAMQGGCTCENACYLRIGQGNIDIAAAAAPKPLGLTAADDWTKELQTKGNPDLVKLYGMLNAGKAYQAFFDIHFKHNYNHVSRTHMYQFVNQNFKLGLASPVLERDFEELTPAHLTVWNPDGSRPANYLTGDDHERNVNRIWAEDGEAKVEAALKSGEIADYRKGWEVIVDRKLSDIKSAAFELVEKAKQPGYMILEGLIRNAEAGEELPALFYYPDNWNGTVTILPTDRGKAGLYLGVPESPTDQVTALLDQGNAVAGADLFDQGEFLSEGETAANPTNTYSGKKELDPTSWERSPVYFYGYNDSLFVKRVHDLLTTLKMVRTSPNWDVKRVEIAARGPFAAITLAAAAFSEEGFDKVDAQIDGFSFNDLDDSFGEHFVPGAVRFGGVKMLARLAGQ